MIKSFVHKGLRRFFETGSVAGIQPKHAGKLQMILGILDQAQCIEEIGAPGLRLHPLKGERAGTWSITVQANWRITFASWMAMLRTLIMRTTTEKPAMRMHNPPHPGRILQELWLSPLGVTLTDAAEALGVSRKTLSKIVNGRGSLTPEMAVRLSITFGNTPEMWLRLQNAHDLWQVEHRRRRVNARPIAA